MDAKEHVHLLIVGSGWHGLSMAKTYLEVLKISEEMDQLKDEADVIILDYAESIGGTWASERLYPGLKTNNIVGSYEFSDFPMDLDRYGLKPCQHIPGAVVHQYLVDFAQHFNLTRCIRLRTKVNTATLLDDGTWLVDVCSGDKTGQLIASKIVLATGLASEPSIPKFPGQDTFTGYAFHPKQLKSMSHRLETSKTVVVIGGNKSAWDVAYQAATSGATVHMAMRPSGGGPCWVWRPIQLSILGIYTSVSRLSLTRLFTWFDPSLFGSVGSPIRCFLHRTALGRGICRCFWGFLDNYICRINRYDEISQMQLMRPWTSTLWMGNSLSIHNYETDWFQLVRDGRIVPHVAEVISLKGDTVALSDGASIEADGLVTCTGWKSLPSIDFYPQSIMADLTLEANATTKVREEVLSKRPSLTWQPIRIIPDQITTGKPEPCNKAPSDSSPLRLYRFMIPASRMFLEKRNFAIIGAHLSIHAVMLAQAQALWLTAFLQCKLKTNNMSNVVYETMLHSEYECIRRPAEAGGAGTRHPDLVFDSLPYMDMLLEDLGMRTRRKTSWLKHVFQPHNLADYRGLVAEWLAIRPT